MQIECKGCGTPVAVDGLEDTDLYAFTVKGHGAFPVQCLVDCRCWPATVEDSLRLHGKHAREVNLVGLALEPEIWRRAGWSMTFGRGPQFPMKGGD